jgi:hypothetical protein
MSYQKTNLEFAENLIKGKAAEIIFQRMFVEMGTAMVIPYGYENVTPVLAQYLHEMDENDKKDLQNVRNMPDYLLIAADDKKNERLVDVKYRKYNDPDRIQKVATEVFERWPSAWMFLATQEGFFFGKCEIIKQEGKIDPLNHSWVSQEKQREYLDLLCKYIKI